MAKSKSLFLRIGDYLQKRHVPVRLILSVVAGIATAAIASFATHEILHLCGYYPAINEPMHDTERVSIELFYHSIYAVGAACVTAHIAREKAKKAVFILGTKEAIMWLIGTILLWKHNPIWYNIAKAFLGIPLAQLGGWIYLKIKERRKQKTSVPKYS